MKNHRSTAIFSIALVTLCLAMGFVNDVNAWLPVNRSAGEVIECASRYHFRNRTSDFFSRSKTSNSGSTKATVVKSSVRSRG